jgi:hypothetical protein
MLYFTTYFDKNYLSRGLVLYDSLKEHCPSFTLYVLCLDDFTSSYFRDKANRFPEIKILSLNQLEAFDEELNASKTNRSLIEYYFTLSPCLPLYLLKKYALPHICSLDADIFFLHSPNALFNYLKDYPIVITPHKFSEEMKNSVRYGYYNVSFQIFRNDESGQKCLEFWRTQCLEWCGDHLDEINNRFADQKYLDEWPKLYPYQVKVLDDQLSGIAPWNLNNYSLKKKNGLFYSNDQRIIFYHFHQFKFISTSWASHGFNEYRVKYTREIGKLYLKYWNRVNKYNKLLAFTRDHSARGTQLHVIWQRLQIEDLVYYKLTDASIFNISIQKLPLIIRKILGKVYA